VGRWKTPLIVNMRILFPILVLTLFLAACNYGGTNPGGHTPEEVARASTQPPPTAPKPTRSTQAMAGGNVDGAQLYNQYCGACHNEGKRGPSLAGVFSRRELPSGTPANDARVKETIKMGRAMMPAFSNVLADDQVDAIVAYLHTI
jgi:mono/diheme cytochrome c family protein